MWCPGLQVEIPVAPARAGEEGEEPAGEGLRVPGAPHRLDLLPLPHVRVGSSAVRLFAQPRFLMVLVCLIFSVLSTIKEHAEFAHHTLFWMVGPTIPTKPPGNVSCIFLRV